MADGAVLNMAEMIDLAIGTPEVGTVDFVMLHTVLHCLAQQLRCTDKNVEVRGALAVFPVGRQPDDALTVMVNEFLIEYTVAEINVITKHSPLNHLILLHSTIRDHESAQTDGKPAGQGADQETILVAERIEKNDRVPYDSIPQKVYAPPTSEPGTPSAAKSAAAPTKGATKPVAKSVAKGASRKSTKSTAGIPTGGSIGRTGEAGSEEADEGTESEEEESVKKSGTSVESSGTKAGVAKPEGTKAGGSTGEGAAVESGEAAKKAEKGTSSAVSRTPSAQRLQALPSSEKLSLVTLSKFNLLQSTVQDLKARVYGTVPNNEELLEGVRSQTNMKGITDMWATVNVSSRLEAAEAGIAKLSSLMQDIIGQEAAVAMMTTTDTGAPAGAAAGAPPGAPAVAMPGMPKSGISQAFATKEELAQITPCLQHLKDELDQVSNAFYNAMKEMDHKIDPPVRKEMVLPVVRVPPPQTSTPGDTTNMAPASTPATGSTTAPPTGSAPVSPTGQMSPAPSGQMTPAPAGPAPAAPAGPAPAAPAGPAAAAPAGPPPAAPTGTTPAAPSGPKPGAPTGPASTSGGSAVQNQQKPDMTLVHALSDRVKNIEHKLNKCFEVVFSPQGNILDQLNALQEQIDQNTRLQFATEAATCGGGGTGGPSPELLKDLQGLMSLYKTVHNMQSQLQQVHETALQLATEKEERQLNINSLLEQIELLKAIKLDREDMVEALADKADLRMLARKVSHDQFEIACDDLSKGLEHALGKLNVQESLWQQALDDIQREIETKLDKVELSPLKDFFLKKMKQLQDNLKQMAELRREAEAAGTKRRMLTNVNCISCDAQAFMQPEAGPSVPPKPLQPTKSMKPYLTYELDSIRKSQATNVPQRNMHDWEKIDKQMTTPRVQKVRSETDKHLCNRYCGGSHTTTTPAQRVARSGHFVKQWGPEVVPLASGFATGDDGKMYKISGTESVAVGPGGAVDAPCTAKPSAKKEKQPSKPTLTPDCRCIEDVLPPRK